MKKNVLTIILTLLSLGVFAQMQTVNGTVVDAFTSKAIPGVKLKLEGTAIEASTDQEGHFSISVSKAKEYLLHIETVGYRTMSIQVSVNEGITNLEPIALERSISKSPSIVTITESELDDDESTADAMAGLLYSSKDVFMRYSAYDFGQVFFKPRGYDSKDAEVLINGIPMNKIYNGRPQWSNWGGLNDVMRNQELNVGLQPSDYTFGSVFGSNYINVRPSANRPGLRLSASGSNRSYKGRLMATYNSGLRGNKFAYTLSASRRWAGHSGYFDGTTYNANSLFASAEYKINPHHSLSAVAMFTPNKRGKNAVLTGEVTDLAGHRYNPYWGWQAGKKRNSRMREIVEPIFIFSYNYNKNNTNIDANIGYQIGKVSNSRIQYGLGQNPEPTYYKNLPSYYINGRYGVEMGKADIQREYFRTHRQLDWTAIYRANMQGTADQQSLYVLSQDVNEDKTLTGNVLFSTKFNDHIKLNAGVTYRQFESENYAEIDDLLGGKYFLNKSYYTGTPYHSDGKLRVGVGDKHQYHYNLNSNLLDAFAQLQFQYGKVDFYLAGAYKYSDYQREGLFENKEYETSYGKSKKQEFSGVSAKAGLTYAISGRHLLQLNGGYFVLPQNTRNMFVNVRNSNKLIPELNNEIQYTADASYLVRLPFLKMRLTGYFTQVEDAVEMNFFYTESALTENVSRNFINLATKGIEKRHFGFEFGAEAKLSPSLTATGAVAMGQHTYNNNPSLYFSSDEIDVETIEKANLKNYKLASGPQNAYAIGLEYRSPKYWWVGLTGNLLTNNYISISHLYRTENFFKNPDTNTFFPNVDEGLARELLTQEKLDNLFLMNLTAGKSWRVKGKYISLFVSVNNLLNKKFNSGGFEQSRTANYEALKREYANGTPTFGTRYFRGYGRTLFINLAISL